MDNLEKYYSVPYLRNGRSFEGCDCFGLFWLWFLHELGVHLPIYSTDCIQEHTVWRAGGPVESLYRYFDRTPWPEENVAIRRHDVLYMTHGGEAHCGIALDKRQFIHSLSKIGVSVSNIPTWKPRIKGVYRYAH